MSSEIIWFHPWFCQKLTMQLGVRKEVRSKTRSPDLYQLNLSRYPWRLRLRRVYGGLKDDLGLLRSSSPRELWVIMLMVCCSA
eukprot:SAG22_NODE_17496_length_303_cov_2.720588_1_plen_82_part_10